jgi:excinuclease UvrABC nuclease subunit
VLPHRIIFDPADDTAFFAEVAAKPAVFLLRGETGEPYVSKTSNLRRRVQRLLGASEGPSRRLNLRERARLIEYSLTGSDFESGLLLYQTLRQEFPKTYADRLRLRMAPLLRFHLENRYPRISVTTKLGSAKTGSIYYGPFPSRVAAEKFCNDALDFFKMRRCVEELNPDPAFPGCVYSEMKMCLAPCFQGCTDEEYAVEVERVREFFDSSGQSLLREIARDRDKASEEMHFETAALLHSKLEKLKPIVAQLPEIVRRI